MSLFDPPAAPDRARLVPPRVVLSVADFVAQARATIERELALLWIGGEISNFTRATSGHCYFTLKDDRAQLRCVMFRGRAALLDFAPRNGQQVEVRAQPTLYEARGEFQVQIDFMRPAGAGALHERFERLKRELADAGLFDAARKRDLPRFPQRIGIVTSLQAAALRDVLTTLRARWPAACVIVYPTPVQGEGAAERIAQAVDCASTRAEVDVLIVCRGGGSLEDLWALNEAVVAHAIARCAVPVVAGIGHETDTTIADFVADVRAPTPTAAAVAATPDRVQLARQLDAWTARLARTARRELERQAQRVDSLERRLVSPGRQLAQQRDALDATRQRLQAAAARTVERAQWRLGRVVAALDHARPDLAARRRRIETLRERLVRAAQLDAVRRAARVDAARAALAHLDPRAVLARGFAIARTADGAIVRDASQLVAGTRVQVSVAAGHFDATVDRVATDGD
ncbi:MAG: exodeoxyribonuclease VII large subunit [Burkholderiales bacterium]|nr:exodeoxyribonuclease VII large subunit [Burkholderiales bacterium]